MPLKAIVLEDEPLVADAIAGMLRDLGHQVCGVAHRAGDLAPLLSAHEPDIVTIDLNLGERRDGIGVATVLEAAGCLPVVFITGAADEQQREDIRATEGAVLLQKPFTTDALREAIRSALNRAAEDSAPDLGIA